MTCTFVAFDGLCFAFLFVRTVLTRLTQKKEKCIIAVYHNGILRNSSHSRYIVQFRLFSSFVNGVLNVRVHNTDTVYSYRLMFVVDANVSSCCMHLHFFVQFNPCFDGCILMLVFLFCFSGFTYV